MEPALTPRLRRSLPRPTARSVAALTALVAVEVALIVAYLVASGAAVLSPRYVAYPFVWINLAVLALAAVDVPAPTDRQSRAAALVAVAYLLVLGWTSGLVSVGGGLTDAAAWRSISVSLVPAMPGWGPVLLVDAPVTLALVPYETVGYVALAALVYVGVSRAAAGVVSGLVGLVTCVSCVGPVLAAVVSGLLGGTSTALAGGTSAAILGATTGAYAYDISTGLFVATVAALWLTLGR